MDKYIPVGKRNKRKQKEYYAAHRGSWNGVNPISRAVPSKKIYNRKKEKQAERRSGWDRGSACFCL